MPVTLASVFTDQMSGIEHASLLNQLIDAGIIFGIASGLKMAEDKTGLVFFRYLWWAAGGLGCYVLYLALFT
jgi:hypothetical protein